jgi:hypothetical protein
MRNEEGGLVYLGRIIFECLEGLCSCGLILVHESLGAAPGGRRVLAGEAGFEHGSAFCEIRVHLCQYYRTNKLRNQGHLGRAAPTFRMNGIPAAWRRPPRFGTSYNIHVERSRNFKDAGLDSLTIPFGQWLPAVSDGWG